MSIMSELETKINAHNLKGLAPLDVQAYIIELEIRIEELEDEIEDLRDPYGTDH